MNSFLLFVFVTTVSTVNSVSKRFDNFQVYRLIPRTPKQLEVLRKLRQVTIDYDFWTEALAIGYPVDIMVPPHLKSKFSNFLSVQKLEYKLWIRNVQKLIDRDKLQATRVQEFDWMDYYTLDSIYNWMDSLYEEYPGVVTPIVGGYTYEKREIRGIKVSFGAGKKAVFIEGGSHAREWISPAVVTYILDNILSSTNGSVRAMAESRDWYFFPVFNPDGYVYTQIDRFWRKTRQPYGVCHGVDLNRNWNYKWMEGGRNNDPCSELFPGSAPFSEIETETLSKFIDSIANNLETYLSFHSYGQLILIPFGHHGLEVPENYDELIRIGRATADSISLRYRTIFRVGNIVEKMGFTSGTSVDYVMGTYKHVRLAYAIELRDTGRDGFILPKEQIIPSGQEILDGLVRMFCEVDVTVDVSYTQYNEEFNHTRCRV